MDLSSTYGYISQLGLQQPAYYPVLPRSGYGFQQQGYATAPNYYLPQVAMAYPALPVNTSMQFNEAPDSFQFFKPDAPAQQQVKGVTSQPLLADAPLPLQNTDTVNTPQPEAKVSSPLEATRTVAKKKVDVFRDTPLRYAGYLNETGEAFKEFIPKSVYLGSYRLTDAYVYGDALHKFVKGYKDSKAETMGGKIKDGLKTGADCYAFQAIASQYGPVLVVDRIKPLIGKALDSVFKKGLSTATRNLGISSISLGIILASVPLIDKGTHTFLNYTVRPLLGLPKVLHHKKEQ